MKYGKTSDQGLKYVNDWAKRGLSIIDILLNQFKSCLYLIKLVFQCNFSKIYDIYNNILYTLDTSESTRIVLIDRKRFHIIETTLNIHLIKETRLYIANYAYSIKQIAK